MENYKRLIRNDVRAVPIEAVKPNAIDFVIKFVSRCNMVMQQVYGEQAAKKNAYINDMSTVVWLLFAFTQNPNFTNVAYDLLNSRSFNGGDYFRLSNLTDRNVIQFMTAFYILSNETGSSGLSFKIAGLISHVYAYPCMQETLSEFENIKLKDNIKRIFKLNGGLSRALPQYVGYYLYNDEVNNGQPVEGLYGQGAETMMREQFGGVDVQDDKRELSALMNTDPMNKGSHWVAFKIKSDGQKLVVDYFDCMKSRASVKNDIASNTNYIANKLYVSLWNEYRSQAVYKARYPLGIEFRVIGVPLDDIAQSDTKSVQSNAVDCGIWSMIFCLGMTKFITLALGGMYGDLEERSGRCDRSTAIISCVRKVLTLITYNEMNNDEKIASFKLDAVKMVKVMIGTMFDDDDRQIALNGDAHALPMVANVEDEVDVPLYASDERPVDVSFFSASQVNQQVMVIRAAQDEEKEREAAASNIMQIVLRMMGKKNVNQLTREEDRYFQVLNSIVSMTFGRNIKNPLIGPSLLKSYDDRNVEKFKNDITNVFSSIQSFKLWPIVTLPKVVHDPVFPIGSSPSSPSKKRKINNIKATVIAMIGKTELTMTFREDAYLAILETILETNNVNLYDPPLANDIINAYNAKNPQVFERVIVGAFETIREMRGFEQSTLPKLVKHPVFSSVVTVAAAVPVAVAAAAPAAVAAAAASAPSRKSIKENELALLENVLLRMMYVDMDSPNGTVGKPYSMTYKDMYTRMWLAINGIPAYEFDADKADSLIGAFRNRDIKKFTSEVQEFAKLIVVSDPTYKDPFSVHMAKFEDNGGKYYGALGLSAADEARSQARSAVVLVSSSASTKVKSPPQVDLSTSSKDKSQPPMSIASVIDLTGIDTLISNIYTAASSSSSSSYSQPKNKNRSKNPPSPPKNKKRKSYTSASESESESVTHKKTRNGTTTISTSSNVKIVKGRLVAVKDADSIRWERQKHENFSIYFDAENKTQVMFAEFKESPGVLYFVENLYLLESTVRIKLATPYKESSYFVGLLVEKPTGISQVKKWANLVQKGQFSFFLKR